MSMIVTYELKPNIRSDQELWLNVLEKDLKITEKQLIADYYRGLLGTEEH